MKWLSACLPGGEYVEQCGHDVTGELVQLTLNVLSCGFTQHRGQFTGGTAVVQGPVSDQSQVCVGQPSCFWRTQSIDDVKWTSLSVVPHSRPAT